MQLAHGRGVAGGKGDVDLGAAHGLGFAPEEGVGWGLEPALPVALVEGGLCQAHDLGLALAAGGGVVLLGAQFGGLPVGGELDLDFPGRVVG